MAFFRVWNIVNPPAEPAYFPVDSPEAGARLIDRMANEQLPDETIVCNAFGLEVQEAAGGEWEEWYDEDGRDVDEAFAL